MLHLLRPLVRVNLKRSIYLNHKMQQQIPYRKGADVPEKLKRAQKLFQEKNNLPVFLKGGKTDKILYYTTMGLSGLGLFFNFVFFAEFLID